MESKLICDVNKGRRNFSAKTSFYEHEKKKFDSNADNTFCVF